MVVTSTETNLESVSMDLVADFDASVDQVWQLWADPDLLSRWWGPPSHVTTFEQFDFVPGGTATFVMNGPNEHVHRGWWRISDVSPPTGLEFVDGFADIDGNVSQDLPTSTVRVTLTERGEGTRMLITSQYQTREGFDLIVSQGMEAGWRLCVGQMDALLTEPVASPA